MRRFLLCGTAALALSSGPVLAGGLVEPAMEPEVVATATKGSSAGILIPVLILVLIAAAVASGGSNGRREVTGISDRRTKTDCVWVGMTADAIPVWRYRYIGAPQVYEGVMAQDVAMRRPDALVTAPSGLMAVNYTRLGHEVRLVA